MIKFIISFAGIWCIVLCFMQAYKFSNAAAKIKAIKRMLCIGFAGIVASVVLFFVVQIF